MAFVATSVAIDSYPLVNASPADASWMGEPHCHALMSFFGGGGLKCLTGLTGHCSYLREGKARHLAANMDSNSRGGRQTKLMIGNVTFLR